MKSRRWIIAGLGWAIIVLLAVSGGCDSAFEPPGEEWEDGDSEAPETESDSDADSEIPPEYNLKITPQFGTQGQVIEGLTIEFTNVGEVRRILEKGNPALQSYQVNLGTGVYIELIRYDPDEIKFYDTLVSIPATTRTGEYIASVRITYGSATVIEYGRFYVLPNTTTR